MQFYNLFFFQDIGEPSVCSEVKGEEDAVHCGIGTQSADSSDRGYYIVCSVHAFAGALLVFYQCYNKRLDFVCFF